MVAGCGVITKADVLRGDRFVVVLEYQSIQVCGFGWLEVAETGLELHSHIHDLETEKD